MRSIKLVFKTHLDIGFTDHAAKVRTLYHERFIPQAIETGQHFWRENPDAPAFIWTTGAWLIWDHLETQDRSAVIRLERAIERGLIRWHALPFTVHSELMTPAVFRAGLSYAQELDRRFGVTTTAAKMTDVPGHTRGIVPLLAEAGVQFLHIGVNTASPVPDVPDVFRWRGPDGEDVIVMYQASYGATHFPSGFDEGLSFAHTNDNMGPQSVPQVVDAYRELSHAYPDATVSAGTLEDYGRLLWARRDTLPVVDREIGDSWIYGSASDPTKTQRLMTLQRLYDQFTADGLTQERLAFGRGLAMVAEHTCGVDIKSYLRDETAWDRPAFEAARRHDFRFSYTEASWAEQRAYLDEAVNALGPNDRERADAELEDLVPSPLPDGDPIGGDTLEIEGWVVRFDRQTGDILAIRSPDGLDIVAQASFLLGYRYESYDAADVRGWLDTYLTHRETWAILDHGKPGLENAATSASASFTPTLVGLGANSLVADLPADAHKDLGAPRLVQTTVTPGPDGLEIAVTMREKPANRMPEASFVAFAPATREPWEFLKMGLWQPAHRVAQRGGGHLQAIAAARSGQLEIKPLDTPLTGPADSPFLTFVTEAPDFSRGLRFCLHNNKWGTNFPMWWEGDLRARFVLRVRR